MLRETDNRIKRQMIKHQRREEAASLTAERHLRSTSCVHKKDEAHVINDVEQSENEEKEIMKQNGQTTTNLSNTNKSSVQRLENGRFANRGKTNIPMRRPPTVDVKHTSIADSSPNCVQPSSTTSDLTPTITSIPQESLRRSKRLASTSSESVSNESEANLSGT